MPANETGAVNPAPGRWDWREERTQKEGSAAEGKQLIEKKGSATGQGFLLGARSTTNTGRKMSWPSRGHVQGGEKGLQQRHDLPSIEKKRKKVFTTISGEYGGDGRDSSREPG